jgi:hypothetical protein
MSAKILSGAHVFHTEMGRALASSLQHPLLRKVGTYDRFV